MKISSARRAQLNAELVRGRGEKKKIYRVPGVKEKEGERETEREREVGNAHWKHART